MYRYLSLVAVVLFAWSCSATSETRTRTLPEVKTLPQYNTLHHEDGDYKNIWQPVYEPSGFKSFGWIMGKMFSSDEGEPAETTDPVTFNKKADYRITWLGHSTVLVQVGDANILLDPVFSERVSPVGFAGPERHVDIPIEIQQLPRIDFVLISHDHYDHLDNDTIETLDELYSPVFIVPLEVKDHIEDLSEHARVIELDWWQQVDFDGMAFTCAPARHFSGRGLFDRNSTLWCSFMVEYQNTRIYYAGDTGYSEHFKEINRVLGAPHIALIPIGAYKPRWFMREVHVDPYEAVQAFLDMKAEYMLGVHWGVFNLADEPLQQPAIDMKKARDKHGLDQKHVFVLPVGGSFEPEQ